MSGVHLPTNPRSSDILLWCGQENKKGKARKGPLWAFRAKLVPDDMAVCVNHTDSFSLDHFDQNFHFIFWLKVNNNTVFEASILEYDRYEPPLGARSCHRYLEF